MWVVLALLAWYAVCLFQVARVAIRATCREEDADCILLLGRRSPGGHPHPDFQARIDRARRILESNPAIIWVLSGGAPAGECSEASIARNGLTFPCATWVEMEEASQSTWHNFLRAKPILARQGLVEKVAVISNRYHLGRCKAMARHMGLPVVFCAAEDRWEMSAVGLCLLLREAGYLLVWQISWPFRRWLPSHSRPA